MAHHIADLVVRAENAKGEDKDTAEKNCFEAILTLWKHRTVFPNGKRPFEDIEPVVRAIVSLDPDNNTPRYFYNAQVLTEEIKEQSEADRWLAIVDDLDYSAKVLIGFCLSEAAKAAVDKSKEWVKLAEAAETELSASEITINFVLNNADLGKDPDSNTEAREQLQDRIKRMGGFIELAKTVVHDLKMRLKDLPTLEENQDITAEKEAEL